jgi:protein SCO1/2
MITNLVGQLAAASAGNLVRPEVIVLSINPDDSVSLAAQKKVAYLGARAVPIDDWHFLIGDPPSIGQLAQEVGLQYVYDSASRQYAHPGGIVLLTPQGKIASYLFGFDFTSAQLAHELSDAAAHRTASRLERVLLVCFHYSPLTGPHSAKILGVLQILSGLSLFALAVFGLVRLVRKHRDRVAVS